MIIVKPKPNPKITIITVCYNSGSDLEDTILNVLELTDPELDYIIIDGGSTDGSLNLIHKYASRLKAYISEPDQGIYDAMNKGWGLADPESFILYLGAGDKILNMPDKENFYNADVIFGDVEIGNKYLFKSKFNFMLRLGNTIHHQAEFVRKKIHTDPPFSLKYKIYSDFNFNQKLLLKKVRFIKDNSFRSYALEGGISYEFNNKEPLEIVKANFGTAHYLLAKLYYIYKKL
ncbi:glycosyltransferase [Pedobacter metabolipauper]|uniref:Glycosyltransferase involved in cell wall biosynthesis n=1 Tax=Pedobacter metabolipauper TaxID=425513 RepID=A0A4R6SX18_9SPHI|nr:glycosyltransferase [Pedobacter metabolipauper]TDQ09966.1 glycosyltransferase involved in cell wall biosynthesis [Pedobacter metabolipauper]